MQIKTLASSSKGNCYIVKNRDTVLMLEAGISPRKVMKDHGIKISGLSGCLISHEHGDHSKYVEAIAKKGINCFMTHGTKKALNIDHHRIKGMDYKQIFRIGSFRIMMFETMHDCVQPSGFIIQSGSEKLLFITDSYYCKYRFNDLTHIMIETNYSNEIMEENIKQGALHPSVKKRVKKSHFELENVKEFLSKNDLSKVKEIHLLHVSQQNGCIMRFKKEIQELTGKPVYI